MIWGAIIVLVIALVVAVAMAPKPPTPDGPAKGTLPEVKDGKAIVRIYGTVWINDPAVLAMKQTGSTPIRKSA